MNKSFDKIARSLHWLMAFLILSNIILAFFMADAPKSIRPILFGIHISFGVLVLEIIFIRIYWMITHPAPAMPEGINTTEQKLAKIVQHTLYLLMLIVPVFGYLMVNAKGFSVSFFKLYSLPSVVEKNKELKELFENIHVFLGWTLAILVGLHIAVAIKHKLAKDGVFDRMWPKK